MRFDKFHNLFFECPNGAFSKVTDREAYDSQITLTGEEYEIVTAYFGIQKIHVGKVASNQNKASKRFLLYNTKNYIDLNLVYPKPNNHELRLYLSSRAGFKPKGGMIWFLFENINKDLVIGAFDKVIWNSLGQYDIDDTMYLKEIDERRDLPDLDINGLNTKLNIRNQEIKLITLSGRRSFQRNPRLAIQRFQLSNYTCEINPNHETFTSLKTNNPFVEAHHFVPMMYQGEYNFSLDQIENIICLCPNCHRGFHHAIPEEKIEFIRKIYQTRSSIKKMFSLAEINGLYNCYDI